MATALTPMTRSVTRPVRSRTGNPQSGSRDDERGLNREGFVSLPENRFFAESVPREFHLFIVRIRQLCPPTAEASMMFDRHILQWFLPPGTVARLKAIRLGRWPKSERWRMGLSLLAM